MVKPVYDITAFTLLDYPDKTACILWFAGCNMRCGYCYNPDIVLGKGKISFEEVLQFLKTRQGLLDAVVLSGGECTMHRRLEAFISEVKQLGFLIKLDTNGTNPHLLKAMIDQRLLDYVALDFKAPAGKYAVVTALQSFNFFEKSLEILQASGLPFEVRTTVHPVLHDQTDVEEMVQYLEQKKYKADYYLQHALQGVTTLVPLEDRKRNVCVANISASIKIVERN